MESRESSWKRRCVNSWSVMCLIYPALVILLLLLLFFLLLSLPL